MKNFKVKVFLIALILLITGGMVPIPLVQRTLATETDEFSELLESEYESEAPTLDVAELSSTFTSEKEIEVYLTTTRNDISEIVISGWSGGAYANFKTSKTAIYDETREIYTVTFNLDEIVNTNTNEIDNADEITYSFDACVYGENNTMSYYTLDDVIYTANGFTYNTETSGDTTTLNINATEDGEVAILKEGEELTDEAVWQEVTAGENSIALMSLDDESETTATEGDAMSSDVQTYQIMYRSALTNQIATASVDVVSSNPIASSSTYVDDDTYSFEISQIDGLNEWTSYEDTPNIFESTIQGKHGETATAVIKINTEHAGILSFDYMSSSEVEFDIFSFEITGATLITEGGRSNTTSTKIEQNGEQDWKNYTGEFDIPSNGVITLTLKYKKDKNVNRYEDRAAIRNLIFTPILPSNGSVEINNGDEYTGSNRVNLKIYVEDATYMHISETSEKPSVNASTWLPLLETTTYTIQNTGDGEKTIYVWFKNDSNAMSLEAATDTIKLDNAAPTTTAPTVESTATEIKVKLNQTDANELTVTEYGYRLAGTSNPFTWSANVVSGEYTITGLTKMQEYEVKTRVSDGINEVVESEGTIIKTKIPSDKIVITSSPSEKTLDNVIVTITWNNEEGYEQEYSLNGTTYTIEPNETTTIEMDKNGIIYYQMNDGTYDTGVQIYNVGNIDREGPVVESVGVETPKSGKYGIGDEITIKVVWDEEIFSTELPVLNIKFNDNINIPLTAAYKITNEITYKYTIKAEDYGDLVIVSLEGGEVKDSLANVASYELPEQTGSEIFAENAAYIAVSNAYYATIQQAINAAGTTPTIIKVTANTELRNTVTIKEGQNITLDLNGKVVSYKSDDSIVTAIENSGTLVIKDSTNTNGEITAYSKERSAYTIINNNIGNLSVENGIITARSDSESVALKSYAIYDKEAGVVTLGINDETVSGTSPEIKATSKNSVGIRLVDASGRLYYSDGIVKGTSESLELASGATAYIMPVGYMEKIETQIEEYGIYKVSYLSNENVVELTIDGKTEKYMTLLEALSRVPSDGRLAEIKMLADETLQEIAKIYEGQNIVLDLNGHTITRNEAIDGIIYGILNNGTLTITDTSEANTGKVQAITDKDIPTYAVYNYTNGTLTLENVTLFAKNGGTNEAYGLDYTGDATSIIKIGTAKIFRDTLEKDKKYLNPIGIETINGYYLNQDTEVVDGITYKINNTNTEANVSLTVNDDVTYYSSVQQAVNAAPTDGTLGEIQVLDDEELYTFIDVIATKNVSIDLNGKTLIAKVMNQAIQNNGNLSIKDTSENEDGLIHTIYDTNKYNVGGITHGAGRLEINSGTIMGSNTYLYKDQVFGIYLNSTAGTVVINGGKLKGRANGIYIPEGMIINNSGDIQTGKVNLPKDKYLAYTADASYVTNYLADAETVATLEQNGITTNYLSVLEALEQVNADGTTAKITMYQSESLGRTLNITAGKNIELDLNGKEIYCGWLETLISNNGNLIVNDSSNGEGKLTGCRRNTWGGYTIKNTGTVEINGGIISFTAEGQYRVIHNLEDGTMIINDGTITGYGGTDSRILVNNENSGTIIINGGNIITPEGTSSKNFGGAINNVTGYIEINGGYISSVSQAVRNWGIGTIVINNAEINALEGNTVVNNSTGTIKVNGGTINSISNAIYNANTGSVEVYGGIINGSTGIYNNSKGKIIIGTDDGTIKNEPVIIGQYAVNQRILGSEVYFYDGIFKGTNADIVSPNTTKLKANETPTEAYFLIITTDDAYLQYGKEDSYYTISYVDVANYELSYTSGSENVVKRYASLKALSYEIPENTKSKITVLNDTVEKFSINISKTQDVLLDLNSKTIVFEGQERAISNSGVLQIIDSVEDGNGGIESFNTLKTSIAIYQKGTLILGEDDGIVSNNKPNIIANKNAVENQNNTTIMYDGRLIGGLPIFNNASSTFTLANGYKTKITTLDNVATKELYLVKQEGITIVPETYEWTNKELNISVNYSSSNLTYQYKINDGEWKEATTRDTANGLIVENISVSENCTIYAQSLDTNGNVVYSEEYEITNIDKTAPSIENVSITTSVATSQTITVTGIKDNENGSGIKSYIVTMDNQAPLESAEWIENAEESITAEVTKNGTWYIYVKDNAGNIGSTTIEATNIDIDAPIVSNIEVISPATGNYFMNEVITMQVNFSEEIVVSGTPTLKIKFGEGEEREITSSNISSNTITYTYTVQAEDDGQLTLVGYNGDGIKDIAGNDYQETEIELIGSKIYVQTRAYIEATNTYYATLKEAIADCSTEATEYTTIKLIQNDEYDGESVEIAAGQKIIIDLNGKGINFTEITTGIINNGDLTITDTSESKSGTVTLVGTGNDKVAIRNKGTGKLQVDEGNITVSSTGQYIYGIYNDKTGTVEINGGKINALTSNYFSYGLRLDNLNAKVIINGGELKGKLNGFYKPSSMPISNSGEATNGKITIPSNKRLAYRLEDGYIVNYLEDGEYSVTLEINGEITKYLSLTDAIYAAPADGTLAKVTMYANEATQLINIATGKNIELDLNGKSIYKQYDSSIFKNYGDLKIIDSSENDIGKIEAVERLTIIENEGNLYFNMGSIVASGHGGCGLLINANNGNIVIDSVDIIGTSTWGHGYGIDNSSNGTLEINGGTIVGESTTNSNQYGIYLNNINSKVIITGGEFKGKTNGIYITAGMKINNTGTPVSGEVNLPVNKYIGFRIEDDYIVNYLEDGEVVATLEVNGEITNYLSVQDAIAAAPIDGKYAKITMYENEYLSRTIEILQGQNIEIDLNGKEIFGSYTINNNGDIVINDYSEQQTGKFVTKGDTGIRNNGMGTVELKGGLINVYTAAYSPRNGIYNAGSGTIKISGGELIVETTHYAYGIYNNSTGNVEMTGGKITNNTGLSGTGIYNANAGSVVMNGGTLYPVLRGIENVSTGTVEISGGEIIATKSEAIYNTNVGNIIINGGTILGKGSGILKFSKSDSEFKIIGGTLINTTSSQMFNPSNKSVDLPENTYLKVTKVQSGDTSVWVGELDEAGDYELTVSGVGTSYHNTLQSAINAAPTDGTFSQIKLLADCELIEGIGVYGNRLLQLDLNGHTIKHYSSTGNIQTFFHDTESTFEIIDSFGTGLIDVKAEGYNATGIYNEWAGNILKLLNVKLKVTSVGGEAYGIYNNSGVSTNVDTVIIDGGNISVKSEIGINSAISGKAYGIYNRNSGGNVIKGTNTEISASSALNDSYGIYNLAKITIGEKDNISNVSSPYIYGETSGIHVNGTRNVKIYDGSITGSTGKAILSSNGNTNADVVTDIEDNTFVYTQNNNDGTETVMLLKNIETLEVRPDEILSNDLSAEYAFEVSYLPTDAGGVKIQVDMSDVNLASVNEIDDGVYSVRPKTQGSGEILVTATDLSGKALTQIIPVIIDSIPPTQTAPSATSTGTSVTITCNQEDEHLDKNEIYYSISADGGNTWSTWNKRATINGLESDTLYLVKTKASDLLGNTSESETTEIKTKLANNSKVTFEPDTMTKENVIVIITWNNPQGTPQYYKVGEDGEWIKETNATTRITVEQNGVTIYTKLVYDGVEESDIKSTTVDNIDRIAPTGTLAINEAYPRYDGHVTLNITTSDDTYAIGDGLGAVAYMYITEENLSEAPAVDDEGWIKYEGDYDAYDYYIQSTDGEVAIYVWLMDKAKNISEALVAETEFIPPIAVLFEDGELKGEFQSIQEAYDEAENGKVSTIIVCQDHTMSSAWTIANGKNIILDLNGKQVKASFNEAIINNGTLEITDSKEGGTFTNTYAGTWPFTVHNKNKLKLSGGTIEAKSGIEGNYRTYAVRNYGANARFEMTGGKIYATTSRSSAGQDYAAYGICNTSTYTAGAAVKITGGTIETEGNNYAYSYGIYQEANSTIQIFDVNISSKSENGMGYGICNLNSGKDVIIGIDDGTIRKSAIQITGSTYGLYRQTGTFNFYDGTIKGSEGNSIVCQAGYITTPTNYGIKRTIENKVETATLMYDSYAPTIESIEVTDFENSNTQVITAKGVEDYGTGIVEYQFTTTATAPSATDTKWINVSSTNGPEEYSKTITTNGKHYFWAIDAAGNVSAVTSIEVNNVKVKATKVSLTGFTMEIGQENTLVATLEPANAEPKSILFTSSDESIAYVDSETGVVTGIKAGTTTMKVTVSNYDDTYAIATCTVTVTEPYVDIPETQTAPTLETGYKQITVTSNQTGNNITATYYAISTDDFAEDIGEWQTSNVFTNLQEGQKYYVKTKIVSADGEVESVSAMTVVSAYKASLDEGGEVTYYESIQDAINAANTSGTKSKITLLNTETRETQVTIEAGKNILLDFNGNELIIVSNATTYIDGIKNLGTLEIVDSVGGGKLKASITSTTNNNVAAISNNGGSVIVKDITISATRPDAQKAYAYGVYNEGNGTITFGEDDGEISAELPKIISTGKGVHNVAGTINFYDGVLISSKGNLITGTKNVKVSDSHYLKEEDTDVQSTAYLTPIVIDDSKAMIMTWNIQAGAEVKLPISSATNMNVKVDWGDGTSNQYIGTTFPTHTYTEGKEYIIKVEGTCATWGWSSWNQGGANYTSYNNYLTEVNAWGELGVTQYGFAHCVKLNYVTSDISEKSTINLNSMQAMFYDCPSLTSLDLRKLNTSKVTTMVAAIEKCTKLETLDVRGWDTRNVINMEAFVRECSSLKEIKLENMNAVNVTTMYNMFYNCTSLEHLDLSGVKISKVTNMNNMFSGNTSIKSILVNETFVVPTTSTNIFQNNTNLKAIILTSKEPTAAQFTNAVSKLPAQTIFYVPNASEEKYQEAWTGDYSEERIEPILEWIGENPIVANTRREFVHNNYSVADITVDNSGDYTVYGYEVNPNAEFDHTIEREQNLTYILTRTYNNGTKLVTEEVARVTGKVTSIDLDAYMITEWTIPSGDIEIQLPVAGTGLNITIDWGDGSEVTTWTDTTKFPTHTYTESGEYDISIRGTCPVWGYSNWQQPTETIQTKYYTYTQYLIGLKQWGELGAKQYGFSWCQNLKYALGNATANTFTNVTTMNSLFYECANLESVDLTNFNTTNVTTMHRMFGNCIRLKSIDLSSFNTTKLTSMQEMFQNCKTLTTLDLTPLDVKKVKNMDGTFAGCNNLISINLSNFHTQSATTMTSMFANCSSLEKIDLKTFDTADVTSMFSMFTNCSKLTEIDVSGFDTSNVTDMYGMFGSCKGLTKLDLSSFNTRKVKSFAEMFSNCTNLSSLNISTFNTASGENMSSMFYGCSALTELDLSHFDTTNVKNMFYMFAGCTGLTKLNLSNWNTGNVGSMQGMFKSCINLTELDISHFNTSNVKNMQDMFNDCRNIKELNLTNFDTSNVTNMAYMFAGMHSIEHLDLSSFNTSNLTNAGSMLFYMQSIESVNLSSFDTTNVDTSRMIASNGKLKSILISNKFVLKSGTLSGPKTIITISEIPVENQFNGMLPTGATLYVPNGSEAAYVEALSGDSSASKIAPILQVSGKDKITVLQNSEYSEEGYTIAGFTKTQLEEMNPSGDASLYGYKATTSGDVDTSTLGEYEVEYTMNRTDKEGNLLVEPTTVTRIVIVVDAPIVIVYEEGSEYDGEWTQNSLTVLVETLAQNTDWIQLKLGEGEWTQNPTYTEIIESGDKLAFVLTETINETIYVREIDISGTATSNPTKGNAIKIDKVKPVIEEAKSKTIDQEVYVKANVSDVGSGVAYIAVTLTEDETRIWEECTVGSEEILHKLDKTGTYYVWVKDEAGMESEVQILKAIKDVKAPEGSIDIVEKKEYSGDKYTNEGEVIININVTDNESEPEETKFALYTEEEYEQIMAGTKEIVWQDYVPSVTWPLKEGEGLNRIYAIFKDLAGNVR